jgi:hypothetical protein
MTIDPDKWAKFSKHPLFVAALFTLLLLAVVFLPWLWSNV